MVEHLRSNAPLHSITIQPVLITKDSLHATENAWVREKTATAPIAARNRIQHQDSNRRAGQGFRSGQGRMPYRTDG
jgi:hypothetical protein